jgi:hypothetical protein
MSSEETLSRLLVHKIMFLSIVFFQHNMKDRNNWHRSMMNAIVALDIPKLYGALMQIHNIQVQ